MAPQIVAIVVSDPTPALEAMLDSFRAGLSDGGMGMSTASIGPETDEARLAELVTAARSAPGIVLATGAPAAQVVAVLDRLHHVAMRVTPDYELIGVFLDAVATTLVALPASDPGLAQAIQTLNGRLYDWGAIIVSPGFALRAVAAWFDNRPGAVDASGALTQAGSDSLERHGRRTARLSALLNPQPSAWLQGQL